MAATARPTAATAATCPRCNLPLDHARMTSGPQICPRCRGAFEAVVFHPPERRVRVAEVGTSGPGGATSCAQHRRNTAVANCGRCGVFICALCKVEADRRVFCPACFDRLAAEGALDSVRTKYRDWGGLGLFAALLGLPFFIFGLGIGPAAVYCGVRAIRERTRRGTGEGLVGAYAAIVLGVLETGGSALFVWSLVR